MTVKCSDCNGRCISPNIDYAGEIDLWLSKECICYDIRYPQHSSKMIARRIIDKWNSIAKKMFGDDFFNEVEISLSEK